ncbi:MAG TPA: sialate O-acetylesterase [Candidatus Kapabacteria bacterium]
MLLLTRSSSAQVSFLSPLPFGILQVHGDAADLWLQGSLGSYASFSFKLSSDKDTSSFSEGWTNVSVIQGSVDTLIRVPSTRRNYGLYWRTGLTASDTGGIIAGLTPGHIIGVAGQSNAEGFSGGMQVQAIGDIRMLSNDSTWQPAHEPTGAGYGGPWIVASNLLYQRIGDTLPIGIVNVAVGASGLTNIGIGGQWIRNPNDPEDSSLYGMALHQFRHAGSELECLCWIQGEQDSYLLSSIDAYRRAFDTLIDGFWNDLRDTFPVFHLQVGGDDNVSLNDWPQVREAERILPPSTIVGTALGRPLVDLIHYSPPTLTAVGTMFASAILNNGYDIPSPLYPPLMPDSFATLDSITDGSIPGTYCFSIRWTRNGQPVKLRSLTSFQYFGLIVDGIPLDTSLIWYRIAPDSTRVLIGDKTQAITLDHTWAVTYDDAAASDHAPIATIDDRFGDTIYATAFYALPFSAPANVSNSVEPEAPSIVPNPASNTISIDVSSLFGKIEATLVSENGAVQWNESLPEDHPPTLSFDVSQQISGTYLLRLSNGYRTMESKFVLER